MLNRATAIRPAEWTSFEDLAAARLMARYRQEMFDREQWPRRDRGLRRLGAAVIAESPELLMLKAWSLHHRGRTHRSSSPWQESSPRYLMSRAPGN